MGKPEVKLAMARKSKMGKPGEACGRHEVGDGRARGEARVGHKILDGQARDEALGGHEGGWTSFR